MYRFFPRILSIRTDSFRVFSVYVQIHSAYSENAPKEFWIIGIELFSFQLLKEYYFKKSMYFCNWTEDLKGIINYLALAWQNNFFPRILIIRGMTFIFEYLGEFEFIFENNVGSWSGYQELAFDGKKRMSKISCKCTFKVVHNLHFSNMDLYSDLARAIRPPIPRYIYEPSLRSHQFKIAY